MERLGRKSHPLGRGGRYVSETDPDWVVIPRAEYEVLEIAFKLYHQITGEDCECDCE